MQPIDITLYNNWQFGGNLNAAMYLNGIVIINCQFTNGNINTGYNLFASIPSDYAPSKTGKAIFYRGITAGMGSYFGGKICLEDEKTKIYGYNINSDICAISAVGASLSVAYTVNSI